MKRKKWNKMVLMCLCFILALAVPVSAAPGKAKQKKIYREFIQKKTVSMSSTYMLNGKKWTGKTRFKIDAFVLLDMNKDGTYELVLGKTRFKISNPNDDCFKAVPIIKE